MRVLIIGGFAALLLAGCLNLQAEYDNAARERCNDITNQFDRERCLDGVEENSRARRDERRSD
jgi:hypothetical protein